MMRTLVLLLGIGTVVPAVAGADWKPAKGPLTTPWTKDVRPGQVLPDYPRPQLARADWQNLNGLWQFQFGKADDPPPIGTTLDDQILVPFPVESALSGVMKHGDHLWYRRTFRASGAGAGKRVLLHFGAVDWEAEVWVNGKSLGTHRGGYDAFEYDVTAALKPSGEQELIVRVFDPTDAGTQPRGKQVLRPGGIFYTPATGIWQTVWMETVNQNYVKALKVVPDVDGGKVRVTAVGAEAKSEGVATVTVLNEDNEPVATESGKLGEVLEIKVPDAKLWAPDSPYLYNLQVDLKVGEGRTDTVLSYFGMRKIAIGPDEKGVTRLLLNGKPLFQVGPLDQGFWPDGIYTAPTDEALKYDIEVTKKLGFNMTRKHVKVEPERWYYWCDRLGLLVWQDMPAGDKGIGANDPDLKRSEASAKIYRTELKAMIDGLVNHPSIIMWVVFNEGWGQFDTCAVTDWTKKYDPSRLVDCASGWADRPCGDVHDFHVYPGPGAPDPEPKRAAVLGEFGGLGLGVDGHTWSDKTWGYKGAASRDDLTRKYETLLRNSWKLNAEKGLSAVVYTQITDVETEANGLLTYDRALIKVDPERAAAANRGDFSRASVVEDVVATSRDKGMPWRYTTDEPASNWTRPDFDDSSWKQGPGGFGTKITPGTVVRTEWKSKDIWLRREFDMPPVDLAQLFFVVHHDEDVEISINGVPAAKASGFTSDYDELAIAPEAIAALKPGKNVLAVHCHQTGGGQYIDVGIARSRPSR